MITNATKAAIIGGVTAVIGILDALGVSFSPHTEFKVTTITVVVLSALAWLSRTLSPKWANDVNKAVSDVTKVATDVAAAAPVVESTVKTLNAKAPATTDTGKKT